MGCTELPVITDNKGKQREEEEQENLKVPAKFSLWSCETWNHKYTARLTVGAAIAATILFVVVAITLPIAIVKHRETIKQKKELTSAEKEAKYVESAWESRYKSKQIFDNFITQKEIKTDYAIKQREN
jgi:uncharacterized membrane protein